MHLANEMQSAPQHGGGLDVLCSCRLKLYRDADNFLDNITLGVQNFDDCVYSGVVKPCETRRLVKRTVWNASTNGPKWTAERTCAEAISVMGNCPMMFLTDRLICRYRWLDFKHHLQ